MVPVQDTELLAAGIPCIDVSCTGHRRGAMGPVRSCSTSLRSKFPEPYVRLHDLPFPPFVILFAPVSRGRSTLGDQCQT